MSNKNKTVYLICGVSGAGKSWVCNQFSSIIEYIPHDKNPKNAEDLVKNSFRANVLYERTALISTYLNSPKTYEVIPLFIIGDFLQVKQQLIDRGGKVTKSLYTRWKRMKSLHKKYGGISGDSEYIYRYLRSVFVVVAPHDVYKATAPNGKVYIGKTIRTMEERKHDHIWEANSDRKKDGYFQRAINKYGNELKWEVAEKTYNSQSASEREIHWIAHYDSANKDKGYNSTKGGDGGKLNPEAEAKRIAAIRFTYANDPSAKKKISVASTEMWKDPDFKERNSKAIAKTRGTDESRARTSEITTNQWLDPKAREERIKSMVKAQNDPAFKKKMLKESLNRNAKEFEAIDKETGKVVGTFLNQKTAADKLGIVPNGISRVLSGSLKHYRGYYFKYT